MPSSIPYDPSLVLANVVNPEAIKNVLGISNAQGPADACQETLNALVAMRRSLDMTKTDLLNLGIDTGEVDTALLQLNGEITSAAAEYCKAKIEAEKAIKDYRKNITMVAASVESPVDYVKTEIKSMPLASDSISMDVQYFSTDSNEQGSKSISEQIASFVSASTSFMGTKASSEMAANAKKQSNEQVSNHSIAGTLVMSVACTHKNASILAPFVLNVDKGIKVWNQLHKEDRLDPRNRKAMAALAQEDDVDMEKAINIVSGMTYGSSFVGMVHILNTTDTKVTESISSMATSIQAQMDAGAFLEGASGGFGVNASIANNVKNLLSVQNINSHVTLICMGAIPSMAASQVKLAVEKFATFDPKANMEALASLQNSTIADQASLKQSAASARAGKQMLSMKESEVKAALSALGEMADGSNQILDINSMMTALDDYLKKASEGKSGVPINYYLKPITKGMLAEMWVAKYYPGEYMAIMGDDSKPQGKKAEGGEPAGDAPENE